MSCVILTIFLIYAMYILCHICLFPCNMLDLGFCVFIHTFFFFVYLIISHLILDFEYSYHAIFPVFNVMQVKKKKHI